MEGGRLQGLTILVTGATGGIGRGLVRLFLQHGAFVAFCDADKPGLAEFAAELRRDKEGAGERKGRQWEGDFSHAAVDVTKENEIQLWIDGVSKSRGEQCWRRDDCVVTDRKPASDGIDGLVNNAAKFVFGSVEEVKSEEWDDVLTTNVRGYALMAKHAVKHMKNKGGSIVHMSSISAFVSQASLCPYNTTKSAIESLSRCIAHDYGQYGIRSNTVCPG